MLFTPNDAPMFKARGQRIAMNMSIIILAFSDHVKGSSPCTSTAVIKCYVVSNQSIHETFSKSKTFICLWHVLSSGQNKTHGQWIHRCDSNTEKRDFKTDALASQMFQIS